MCTMVLHRNPKPWQARFHPLLGDTEMLAKLRALAHNIRVAIITEDPHNDATSRLDRMDGVTNIDGVKHISVNTMAGERNE